MSVSLASMLRAPPFRIGKRSEGSSEDGRWADGRSRAQLHTTNIYKPWLIQLDSEWFIYDSLNFFDHFDLTLTGREYWKSLSCDKSSEISQSPPGTALGRTRTMALWDSWEKWLPGHVNHWTTKAGASAGSKSKWSKGAKNHTNVCYSML